jgi:hypothetical protein
MSNVRYRRLALDATALFVRTRFVARWCVVAGCCVAAGCYQPTSYIRAAWKVDPSPIVVGAPTAVRVTLLQEDGKPVVGAKLHMQAHMPFVGNTPIASDVTERQGGVYEGRFLLTAPGDWVIVVDGELTNGSRITRDLQLPDVRAAQADPGR